jgi:NAD(P)H dehydrogenase (quinone)
VPELLVGARHSATVAWPSPSSLAWAASTAPSGTTRTPLTSKLAGKRALVLVSSGSPEPALGPRGINGQLDQVLFPLLHGTLWYVGMSVLPPALITGADRVSDEQYATAATLVRDRVGAIADTEPLAYRLQNGGDYDDDLVLRPHLAPGRSGLSVHYSKAPGI